MKLTAKDTSNLLTILAVCNVGGIESIVIEDGIVRGANAEKTFAIISNENIPKLPQKMGLGSSSNPDATSRRLSSLRQRLELFAGSSDTIIEVRETERGEIS